MLKFAGKKVVLASASPRRQELLKNIVKDYETFNTECDEYVASSEPEEITSILSKRKAMAVIDAEHIKDSVVIGADTVVCLDYDILIKPSNEEEAYDMLERLNGRGHEVVSGVTILVTDEHGKVVYESTFSESTNVEVAPMNDEEINEYIATGEPMDKCGGYGIQGEFSKYVTEIMGDYYNVMGLPVARLYKELKLLDEISTI
ncbi:MAG: Maf family protein [Eubacterium sp.]|nr:Maf family protein [Eubacterium sp.]